MLFLLFAVASGLAPLLTAKDPIEQDGLRGYIVLFSESDDAPQFDGDLERLRNWAKHTFTEVDPGKIHDCWSIGTFNGFPAWLSDAGVDELRDHRHVRLLEEFQRWKKIPLQGEVASSPEPAFWTRPDWGQVRIQQVNPNLATIPDPNLYANGYPSGSAPVYTDASSPAGSWNWAPGLRLGPLDRGAGSLVFIVDGGMNYQHQEFMRNGVTRVQTRLLCLSNCTTGGLADSDPDGHGTHVGAVAIGNYRGVAPQADVISIRIYDANDYSQPSYAISALSYANKYNYRGLKIFQMSSGWDVPSAALEQAIDASFNNGSILTVIAAGNSNVNACTSTPGKSQQAVNVGMTDSQDTRNPQSNWGSCVDIFAPGTNIHSAFIGGPTTYFTATGTSVAAPFVSGALAAQTLGLTPLLARNWLYSFSTKNIVTDPMGSANRLVRANLL